MSTYQDSQDVIGRAAAWFDEHWPTEEVGRPWYDAVNLQRLDMMDSCLCVCGQLGGVLAEHEGYTVRSGAIELTDDRYYGSDGYFLFTAERQDFNRDTERELAALLRKRLGVDQEVDTLTPDSIGDAFIPIYRANQIWAEEIRRRRRGGTG